MKPKISDEIVELWIEWLQPLEPSTPDRRDAAADASLELWIKSIAPPPADGGAAMRVSMRPMFRAIFTNIEPRSIIAPETVEV